jgi:hypothetical protein
MKLTQKQKDDLMVVLEAEEMGKLVTDGKVDWRALLKFVGFWLLVIAIPLVLLLALDQ